MQNDSDTHDPSAPEDEVFGGINLLTRSLRDLDDRGLVLSLAAFAEEALGELLKTFMMPSEATSQLLDGFTEKSRFVILDFNGEYTGGQLTDTLLPLCPEAASGERHYA